MDRTNGSPFYAHHWMADVLEHSPDLTISPLAKNNFIPAVSRHFETRYLTSSEGLSIDRHTLSDPTKLFLRGLSSNLDTIAFFDFSRSSDLSGQCSIIGENHESLTLEVQSSGWIQSTSRPDQACDQGAIQWIRNGTHHSGRFVDQIVFQRFRMDQLATHLDVILARVGLGSQLGDRLPIYGDTAVKDELLSFAARGNSRSRYDLL